VGGPGGGGGGPLPVPTGARRGGGPGAPHDTERAWLQNVVGALAADVPE
jgi:hypothetical protein